VAGNIQSAIAKLKHKDVRQRRRAVRILFDSDAYESVEAFSIFLEDNDVWFRNKAIEAYRRWAPLHAPHLLEDLAKQGQLDGQRCVATVLETIYDSKLAAKLSRLLLKSEDDVVIRRAVHQLISSKEFTDDELGIFQSSEDHVVRAYATAVNGDPIELLKSLEDPHPEVRRQAASTLLHLELETEQNKTLQHSIENDDALWKFAVPIALEQARPNLAELMNTQGNNQRRFLVESLKQAVKEADDPRLRTLIDGNCTSIVARWLVGRNDVKSDELRYELLFDNRVDSIDKSRLLERLLHRQGEDEIQELAEKLLSESTDELILSAAQNLYTA
jgi:HEAT repeat protein